MNKCFTCNELRRKLLHKLISDPTVSFQIWFYDWLRNLHLVEFMKEFFMNTDLYTRVSYEFQSEIKKHVEEIHEVKFKEFKI